MKKLFLVVAVVLVAAISANSQVKFGPKVGLNFSTMSMKMGGESAETKMLVGYSLGVTFKADLGTNLFLQPSILYSSKGSKYDANDDFKITANYVELPVNFGYKLNLGGSNVLLLAGPYFAYGVGGTAKLGNEEADIEWGSDEESDDFKPFDMGLNIGAGFEVNNFQIAAQYGFGLTNISVGSGTTTKNGVLSLSVAYLF